MWAGNRHSHEKYKGFWGFIHMYKQFTSLPISVFIIYVQIIKFLRENYYYYVWLVIYFELDINSVYRYFGWSVSYGLSVTEFWSLMCSLIHFFVKPHTLSITDDSNFHSHRDDRVKAHGNRSVLVSIATKLRYIRPGIWNPTPIGASGFSLLQNFHTGSGAHLDYYDYTENLLIIKCN